MMLHQKYLFTMAYFNFNGKQFEDAIACHWSILTTLKKLVYFQLEIPLNEQIPWTPTLFLKQNKNYFENSR